MLLKNKVILITGSTTGIGAAIARRCSAEGAKVMIHGNLGQESLAEERVEEVGGPDVAGYILTDLTDVSTNTKIMEATLEKFGTLDGLVNNAGISPRHTIDTVTYEEIERVYRINLFAPMLISKDAVAVFRKQKKAGVIINIGSLNAYCGQTDLLIYATTKGALMTMTRNLADALGTDLIRVNQMNVGWTVTPNELEIKRGEGLPDDWESQLPKVYAPTGQLERPENIAAHVVFWLSEQSAPTSAAVYELEEYPVIGRNRINDLTFKKKTDIPPTEQTK